MDFLNGVLRIFVKLTKWSGSLGKVRFWAGEFGIFFQKSVGPPLRFNRKNS